MKNLLTFLVLGSSSLLSAAPDYNSGMQQQAGAAMPQQRNMTMAPTTTMQMPSDQDIQSKIDAFLTNAPVSKKIQGLNVEVMNGVVTLRGATNTHENKRIIAGEIRDINGVRRVYNHITVSQPKS